MINKRQIDVKPQAEMNYGRVKYTATISVLDVTSTELSSSHSTKAMPPRPSDP